MFVDAIGLAPLKDVFWSTQVQSGANYTSSPTEVFLDREIFMAILSTGPVAPGDGIGYASKRDIKGIWTIVFHNDAFIRQKQPCKFFRSIDCSNWFWNFFRGDDTFHIIFASSMKRDYLIYPSMMSSQPGVICELDKFSNPKSFNGSYSVHVIVRNCGNPAMCV